MAGRHAGKRRKVLTVLGDVRRRVAWMRDTWTVSGTVTEFPDMVRHPGGYVSYGRAVTRKRLTHEYPENRSAAWAELIKNIDDLMLDLDFLRSMALEEFHRCEQEENGS